MEILRHPRRQTQQHQFNHLQQLVGLQLHLAVTPITPLLITELFKLPQELRPSSTLLLLAAAVVAQRLAEQLVQVVLVEL
jgi:hypothetical protein